MRLTLIIICIILLLFYIAVNCKIKESSILRLGKSLMSEKYLTQKHIYNYVYMLDMILDMPEIIDLDVTGDLAVIRALYRKLQYSTIETFTSDFMEVIHEYDK